MHELGIVTHVAKTIDEVAEENNISEVSQVVLQIGEVSGIISEYFVDCWNYFKTRHPVLKNSELVIETVPAVTFCGGCEKTYETVRYGKICPYCQSRETWLLQGNETVIKEIVAN